MRKLYITLFFLIPAFCFGQSPAFSKNGLLFPYDKVEHFLGSEGLYYGNRHILKLSPSKSFAVSILCGFLWEVKDELLPWEEWGVIGGEGFDKDGKYDLLSDLLGVTTAYSFDRLLNYFDYDWRITLCFSAFFMLVHVKAYHFIYD